MAGNASALSTTTVIGADCRTSSPTRTRTAPMRAIPGRAARSERSRVKVRTEPSAPLSETSVTSREPSTVNPSSDSGSMAGGAVA